MFFPQTSFLDVDTWWSLYFQCPWLLSLCCQSNSTVVSVWSQCPDPDKCPAELQPFNTAGPVSEPPLIITPHPLHILPDKPLPPSYQPTVEMSRSVWLLKHSFFIEIITEKKVNIREDRGEDILVVIIFLLSHFKDWCGWLRQHSYFLSYFF